LKGKRIRYVQRGAVDSDSEHHTKSRFLSVELSTEGEQSGEDDLHPDHLNSDQLYIRQISCFLKNLSNSRLRSQWSFLDVLHPANVNGWRLMSARDLKYWDIRRASGNMMYNDESKDSDIWSSNSLAQFLSATRYKWSDHMLDSHHLEQELSARVKLGCLFASIMKNDITRAHWYVFRIFPLKG
jgi:hypothetical protein